jgi:hypothetical protein
MEGRLRWGRSYVARVFCDDEMMRGSRHGVQGPRYEKEFEGYSPVLKRTG